MGKFRFILGAATGAAAALLLAPRSGKETRALLSEKLEDAAESAPEPIRNAAEQVEGVYNRVSNTAAEVAPDTDDIKAKIAEARDALAEQITRNHTAATTVEADVEDLVEGVEEAAEDLGAKVEDAAAEAKDVAEETFDNIKEAIEDAVEDAADDAEDAEEAATDAAESNGYKVPDWYK